MHDAAAMIVIALLAGPAWLRTGPATDSASAATAMATGRKTGTGNISWNAGDLPGDSLEAFTEILRDSLGYAVGIVTTVPFSHATPAAFISHDPDRDHYYSGASGNDLPGISEDIILGSRPAVCLGAGHPNWDNPHWSITKGYIGREMLRELRRGLEGVLFLERVPGAAAAPLLGLASRLVDPDGGAMLMGLYGGPGKCIDPGRVSNGGKYAPATPENPTLAQMTAAALCVLARDDQGFFLLVEQGDIDWACHRNNVLWLLGAMRDMELAVLAVERILAEPAMGGTVLLITADHECGGLEVIDERALASGRVPRMEGADPASCPDREVVFHSVDHTNAGVNLYACGPEAALELLDSLTGTWPAPAGGCLDNTQIADFFRIALIERRLARNGILLIGDGMGPVQERAASLFLHGGDGMLAWQDSARFPFRCRVATWDIDTYDARAIARGLPRYSPDSFDPGVASP